MSKKKSPMKKPFRFQVDRELDGERLARAVARRVEALSVRSAKILVDRGRVFLDDRRTLKASLPVREGEWVEVHPDRPDPPAALPGEAILWEGSSLVALNKPAGMPVTGPPGQTEDTVLPLLEALLRRENRRKKGETLQLVHRLDRDTSGLLLVARTPEAARFMEKQFLQREVHKRYRVLVQGRPEQDRFRRDSPVKIRRPPGEEQGRKSTRHENPGNKARQSVRSVTEFGVIEFFPESALVEARPLTGRTHQIRIHLAQLGLPVLGDLLYGSQRCTTPLSRAVPRQMLHAEALEFRDPDSGEGLSLHAPVPEDMETVLEWLRAEDPAHSV